MTHPERPVEALRIDTMTSLPNGGARLTGKRDGVTYTAITSSKYIQKQQPVLGGYFLRHHNGSEDYLTADQFHKKFVHSAKRA
jgi:hypothetical protein